MESNTPDNKVLKKYAIEVQNDKIPPPRFGHTVNVISKTCIVIFGGHYYEGKQQGFRYLNDTHFLDVKQSKWIKIKKCMYLVDGMEKIILMM